MSEARFDVASSPLDIDEHTVLARSDEQSEDFWNKTSERMVELHDLNWAKLKEDKRAELFIKAQEKPYITLSEAVCSIHEWLLAMREEILIAETQLWEGDDRGC
ncbi:hypothetical protein LY76DRAFT_609168 [Colletotrichum caudatum]|nr:hypothetical protein LY76DRAFT_609168 [Colletotrichum caudatum]